jgi:hypothetical protein
MYMIRFLISSPSARHCNDEIIANNSLVLSRLFWYTMAMLQSPPEHQTMLPPAKAL